jgi:7-carboxy-7-deazaguanine synthase
MSSLPMVPETKTLRIPITEMYVDVLQGEGMTSGTPCSFVRFTGCHRECSWCDSKHTWDPKQMVTTRKSPEEVYDFLMAGESRKVIFTGGEPLLHQKKAYFHALLDLLETDTEWTYEIETEGFHVPISRLQSLANDARLQVNCSPKLKNAGMGDLSQEYANSGGLSMIWSMGGIFKFVIREESDVVEALELLVKSLPYGIDATHSSHKRLTQIVRDRVWLMPEGETKEKQLEAMDRVYDLAIKYGLNFSPRLHVLRHDSKKGV